MEEIFSFFLIAFITICFAGSIAKILRIPSLIVYIIAGILAGPSGLSLITDIKSLEYFYELGIILLMFSAGLELKLRPLLGEKISLRLLYFSNMLVPGLTGLIFGFFITKYLYFGNPAIIAIYMMTVFSSPAIEVMIQSFREFTRKIEYKKRIFSEYLIMSSIIADITSLFIFTGLVAYSTLKNPFDMLKFIAFSFVFFATVIKILPAFREKILSKIIGEVTSEEETTILLMLVVIVVATGALLHIPAIACSFLAGISLANIHINRRVQNNIDFLASSIFVPIVFIIIGTRVNFSVFQSGGNFLFIITAILCFIIARTLSIYFAARISAFPPREAAGFGFFAIPELTGTLAIAVTSYKTGIIPDILFNSVVTLCIITTVSGPLLSRLLLFPNLIVQPQKILFIGDFAHFDIKPFHLLTSICDIARKLKYTEFHIYPVVDDNGIYKGVIHLEDLRYTMFEKEMACLVISADVLDPDYPYIEKEATVKEAMEFFTKPGIYMLPVVELVDEKPIYEGVLFLQDILPEIQYVSK